MEGPWRSEFMGSRAVQWKLVDFSNSCPSVKRYVVYLSPFLGTFRSSKQLVDFHINVLNAGYFCLGHLSDMCYNSAL